MTVMDIDLCFWVNDIVRQSEYEKLWDIDIYMVNVEKLLQGNQPNYLDLIIVAIRVRYNLNREIG